MGAVPAALAGELDDARGESDGLRVVVCLAGLLAGAGGVGGVGEGGHFWGESCEMWVCWMGYGGSILDGFYYGVIQCRGDIFSLFLAICRCSEEDQCPGEIGRLIYISSVSSFWGMACGFIIHGIIQPAAKTPIMQSVLADKSGEELSPIRF